jgi:hypothetical protein
MGAAGQADSETGALSVSTISRALAKFNRHPPDSAGFEARIVLLTGFDNRKSLSSQAVYASAWKLEADGIGGERG